jgi:hypothetical protein
MKKFTFSENGLGVQSWGPPPIVFVIVLAKRLIAKGLEKFTRRENGSNPQSWAGVEVARRH